MATLAASPQLLLERVLVVAVLAIVLLGHQLPADMMFLRMMPGGVLIVGAWQAPCGCCTIDAMVARREASPQRANAPSAVAIP